MTRVRCCVTTAIQLWMVTSLAAQAPAQRAGAPGQRARASAGPAMTLTVSGFPDGGQIPVKFSQAAEGAAPVEGTSPAITWSNAPAGTQSFFLNMHDMDVARNKTTDDQAHWVVWNIPATATGLPEGVPKGSQRPDGSYQISATGAMYRGPGAPANGPPHDYMFEIHAPAREAGRTMRSSDPQKRVDQPASGNAADAHYRSATPSRH